MKSAICTLFEGHYHHGVAGLVNSLFKQGFTGDVYVGYRGSLPAWASAATVNNDVNWTGCKTLHVTDGLQLYFIPLVTEYHLTNYKPDFMLQIWRKLAVQHDALFYFDPDIVVTAPWYFFEEWINYGVALCEDINSPLAENHPRRKAWRRYFGEKGIALAFKDSVYVNGGFVGLHKNNLKFLDLWKKVQEAMAPAIGGLGSSIFNNFAAVSDEAKGPFAPFGKSDQDALNATVEAWGGEVSSVGQDGMAFKGGTSLMPHAIGPPKPWQWKPIAQALNGRPPRIVDQEYWKNSSGPIRAHSNKKIFIKKMSFSIASALGRFYRRR